MKVGVPLANWICFVFNEYIFWSNASSKRLSLHNSKTAASSSYQYFEGWFSQCAIGKLLLDMHLKHYSFLYPGTANSKGIVDIGIVSFAKSDLVSCGMPLG